MTRLLNIIVIFLIILGFWYFLFIAMAEKANTVSKLDYRINQGKQEIINYQGR